MSELAGGAVNGSFGRPSIGNECAKFATQFNLTLTRGGARCAKFTIFFRTLVSINGKGFSTAGAANF